MPEPDIYASSMAAIAARLKRLRIALAPSQAEFARHLRIGPTAWGNYETATKRISIDVALTVCARTGATLDWIYRGIDSTMPVDLLKKIEQQRPVDRRKRA